MLSCQIFLKGQKAWSLSQPQSRELYCSTRKQPGPSVYLDIHQLQQFRCLINSIIATYQLIAATMTMRKLNPTQTAKAKLKAKLEMAVYWDKIIFAHMFSLTMQYGLCPLVRSSFMSLVSFYAEGLRNKHFAKTNSHRRQCLFERFMYVPYHIKYIMTHETVRIPY